MLGSDAVYFEDRRMCSPTCDPRAVAVVTPPPKAASAAPGGVPQPQPHRLSRAHRSWECTCDVAWPPPYLSSEHALMLQHSLRLMK